MQLNMYYQLLQPVGAGYQPANFDGFFVLTKKGGSMIKVQVLSKCEYFDGKAYLPVGEQEDYHGRKYVRYKPCPYCESSGSTCKWVEWPEFLQLLEEDECPYEHVSHIGAYDNSPDGVWDDVEGICNAYGKIL